MTQGIGSQVRHAPTSHPETFPRLGGGLIVSCQALSGMPFDRPEAQAEMALAAELGGAAAVRVNTPANIAAVNAVVSIPILGVYKLHRQDHPVYITPTREAAEAVVAAGADLVAVDGTDRPHWPNEDLQVLVARIHALGVPVVADIATVRDAKVAEEAGADAVATTLNGLTGKSARDRLSLVCELVRTVQVPVLLEGGVTTPDEARRALQAGAFAVVVGRAITMPHLITRAFVDAMTTAGPGP